MSSEAILTGEDVHLGDRYDSWRLTNKVNSLRYQVMIRDNDRMGVDSLLRR